MRPASQPAPCTRPIAESLSRAGPLASLLERVRASQARLAALAGTVPAELLAHLQAGPLDDEGWTLLAANSAVAAKLRHLLPLLADALQAQGWEATPIKIKVQSARSSKA